MRICESCGAEFSDHEDFCPECGEPVYEEPADSFEDPEEHLKTCPQCGEYVPLDAMVCPSCKYVFRKKSNLKLYGIIGGGVATVVLIVLAIVFLIPKGQPAVDVNVTEAPLEIVTQAPAEDTTTEPTAEPVPVPTQAPAAIEEDILSAHKDEAQTVFELLDEAAGGEPTVTVTSLNNDTRVVSVASAEEYVKKLLSLAFGTNTGFEYNFYHADDSTWRLVMSGTLKDDQMAKMLSLEDSNIYATFRNMYLNTARQIIVKTLGKQPTITLSVYGSGKSGDDYTLRIVETEAGNGTVSRAEQ